MRHIPAKRRKSGFTLIELLVVIAIIAILAAILFPVFARARENARRASCQSNEKNIALGFKQYIQDNGEKYPPAMTSATALRTSVANGGLSEYIKSTAILFCPSDSDKTSLSYAYMGTGQNESAIDNLPGGTAGTVLLKEAAGNRHFNGMNVAYVDGHVKWKTGETPADVIDPNDVLTDTSAGALGSNYHTGGFATAFGANSTSKGGSNGRLTECASVNTACTVKTTGIAVMELYVTGSSTSQSITTVWGTAPSVTQTATGSFTRQVTGGGGIPATGAWTVTVTNNTTSKKQKFYFNSVP